MLPAGYQTGRREFLKYISLTPEIYDYLCANSVRETDIQRRLGEATAGRHLAEMISPPEVAQFLGLLVGLTGARNCLEVGVFTGYATLAIAMALPADGRVIACDVDAEAAAVGQAFWQEAGVAERIDLRIGAAGETLDALIAAGEAGSYDFAFIDADKVAYAGYYEQALTLLRPGGLIVVDNVLWGGSVADPENTRKSTLALRDFNTKVHTDERVTMSLLPMGDGLILAVKRS